MAEEKIARSFIQTVKNFLKIIANKLGHVALTNIVLLMLLTIFLMFSVISEALENIAYVAADIFSQFTRNQSVEQNIDTTPFYQYALFLFLIFVVCMYVVFKDKQGKLWRNNKDDGHKDEIVYEANNS